MGQYYEEKNGQVHAYVGPDIQDGEPFRGNGMRDADGNKTYGHYGTEPGSDEVGVFRGPGEPGGRSPKW